MELYNPYAFPVHFHHSVFPVSMQMILQKKKRLYECVPVLCLPQAAVLAVQGRLSQRLTLYFPKKWRTEYDAWALGFHTPIGTARNAFCPFLIGHLKEIVGISWDCEKTYKGGMMIKTGIFTS